jgi:hypothetical protein
MVPERVFHVNVRVADGAIGEAAARFGDPPSLEAPARAAVFHRPLGAEHATFAERLGAPAAGSRSR